MTTESTHTKPQILRSQEQVEHYELMTDRNTGIISDREQEIISQTVISQAGVGGNSDVAITLAQMGFQHFRLADPDEFEVSNFNRQLGASSRTVGRNKAYVIKEIILDINPNADIRVFTEGVTHDNLAEFLQGADIVIDGLDVDVMELRKEMFDLARKNGQAVITCPALGWGAAIGVFHPTRSPTFTEIFGEIPPNPRSKERQDFNRLYGATFLTSRPAGVDIALAKRRAAEGKPSAIAAACRLNAALVATAIYRILFDKGNLPIMPNSLHFDMLGAKLSKVGRLKRWLFRKLMSLLIKRA